MKKRKEKKLIFDLFHSDPLLIFWEVSKAILKIIQFF